MASAVLLRHFLLFFLSLLIDLYYRGTYSAQDGIYELNQCKPCSGGRYCDGEHLPAPTGR